MCRRDHGGIGVRRGLLGQPRCCRGGGRRRRVTGGSEPRLGRVHQRGSMCGRFGLPAWAALQPDIGLALVPDAVLRAGGRLVRSRPRPPPVRGGLRLSADDDILATLAGCVLSDATSCESTSADPAAAEGAPDGSGAEWLDVYVSLNGGRLRCVFTGGREPLPGQVIVVYGGSAGSETERYRIRLCKHTSLYSSGRGWDRRLPRSGSVQPDSEVRRGCRTRSQWGDMRAKSASVVSSAPPRATASAAIKQSGVAVAMPAARQELASLAASR